MITPILKDPKAHGGTLYTFPSASKDLTRAFTNSEYEFSFCNFACLNLPDFRYGKFKDTDLKGIYFDELRENCIADSAFNFNRCLKWHIQSYIMNYEIAILNGYGLDSKIYDGNVLRTPSERIFFNWLQKVGGIRFNVNKESLTEYGNDADKEVGYYTLTDESELDNLGVAERSNHYRIGNKLYSWKGGEWRGRVLVSKTVQYIGNIDMVNNVNVDCDSFNEIYLNIPSGVGASTDVEFYERAFDSNYQNGEEIYVGNSTDFIIGRNGVDGDVTLEAIYDDALNFKYVIDNGYCINFKGLYNGGIDGMNMNSEEDFEFNCVLIYYKIKKGNEEAINLYGILLLEEVVRSDYNTDNNDYENDERGGYIHRYPKFKNGNSWGLKLDLKIDAQPDSQLEMRDRIYDDPNDAVGMQMFSEALVHLNDCAKLFYEVKKENTDIEERLYTLENIVSGVDTVYDLRDEVGELRTRISMMQSDIESLDGNISDLNIKMSLLETNLGNLIKLISDVK